MKCKRMSTTRKKVWSQETLCLWLKRLGARPAAAAGVLTMVEVDGKVIDGEEVLGNDATKKRSNIDVCTIQEFLCYSGAHGVVYSSEPSLLN